MIERRDPDAARLAAHRLLTGSEEWIRKAPDPALDEAPTRLRRKRSSGES